MCLREYGSIAAYLNDAGDIVLRQSDDFAEDDPRIIIAAHSAERVVVAIRNLAKEGIAMQAPGQLPLALPGPSHEAK